MAGDDYRNEDGSRILHRRETNTTYGWHKILTLRDKYNLKIIKEANNIVEFTGVNLHAYFSFRNSIYKLKGDKIWYKDLRGFLKKHYANLHSNLFEDEDEYNYKYYE